MEVSCRALDRDLTATIVGEVDHHAAREIMGTIERSISTGLPRRLTLDLKGVTFMDSSGIAVLLRAYQRMAALGGTVSVVNVPSQAKKVLSTAGVDRIVTLT